MVHMGISDDPRVSKLPCGESVFAVRENASMAKKISEARDRNCFCFWFF